MTMDPFSLTTGCIGLAATITKLSIMVTSFVSEVRAARSDLDGVSRELISLKTILELIKEDLSREGHEQTELPETLQRQINGIILNCKSVISEISDILSKHIQNKIAKKIKWAISDQKDVNKLRSSLEAHKSALEIALDMIQL
jgi:hypothetical protein